MKLPQFTKLPVAWINEGDLKLFRWDSEGSDNLAALMMLTVIVNHIEAESGVARVTYDSLTAMASLSRQKVSAGLDILTRRKLITREPEGRSTFGLCGYNPSEGWAKFPARGLYRNGEIMAFTEFRLRRRAELDALKLYFLFAARRNRATNYAQISYNKIEESTGVTENYIRSALTVLGANGLIHIERLQSRESEKGVSNAYRLCNLDTRMHMGTIGRTDEFDDAFAIETL